MRTMELRNGHAKPSEIPASAREVLRRERAGSP
jgi:hypothetical protein